MDDKELCLSVLISQNFWMVNKKIIKVIGFESAGFLSVLMDRDNQLSKKGLLTNDGWFYQTIETIKDELGFSIYTQNQCINILTEKKFIVTENRGLPSRRHFRILYENIKDILTTVCGPFANLTKPDTSVGKEENTVCERSANLFADRSQQIRTKEQEQISVRSASHSTATPRSAELHPRKKILINKTAPLKIEDESCPPRNKPLIHVPKRIFVPKKSNEVLTIFDYWESKGFPLHQKRTKSEVKTIRDINSLLDGTLFDTFKDKSVVRKYALSEIKRSIDNFALATFHKDYQPAKIEIKNHYQHNGFCYFFYDPRKGGEANKSLFLKFLYHKPKLISESIFFAKKDELPHITKVLSKWYHNKFSNRGNGDGIQETNAFIIASTKLKQFLEDNKPELRLKDFHTMYGCYDDLKCLAIQLTRTMDKELRDNDTLWRDFHPGWFTTENTFAFRLPKFLKSERMMKQ